MQKTPAVFGTQDQLYPIIYKFAHNCNLRKAKKEIAKLLTSEQRCRNYPSLFEIYTSWANENPHHTMVMQTRSGARKCNYKKSSTSKKTHKSYKVDKHNKGCRQDETKSRCHSACPLPKRKKKSSYDCDRSADCHNATANNCLKSDRFYKDDHDNRCSLIPQSYRKTYRGRSTTADWVLPGQSDSDSLDSSDEEKPCAFRDKSCKNRSQTGGCSGSGSVESACDIEALRRINENLIRQNEALTACPYKTAHDLDPDQGLSKKYFEERCKRLKEMITEMHELKEEAVAEVRRLKAEIKKLEESEETATSRYKAMKADNRKLKCKVQSMKDELRFQIQTNNEEIKRLNMMIIEAHRRESEATKRKDNIPLLLERVRKEYEEVQEDIKELEEKLKA